MIVHVIIQARIHDNDTDPGEFSGRLMKLISGMDGVDCVTVHTEIVPAPAPYTPSPSWTLKGWKEFEQLIRETPDILEKLKERVRKLEAAIHEPAPDPGSILDLPLPLLPPLHTRGSKLIGEMEKRGLDFDMLEDPASEQVTISHLETCPVSKYESSTFPLAHCNCDFGKRLKEFLCPGE